MFHACLAFHARMLGEAGKGCRVRVNDAKRGVEDVDRGGASDSSRRRKKKEEHRHRKEMFEANKQQFHMHIEAGLSKPQLRVSKTCRQRFPKKRKTLRAFVT